MSDVKSSSNIKNGWFKEEDKWYYYEDNKKLNTQWIQSKGRYYYLEKDAHMVKGWFQTTKDNNWYYSFPEETVNNDKTFYEGEICTGWLNLNAKWYFFLAVKNSAKEGTTYCSLLQDELTICDKCPLLFICDGIDMVEANYIEETENTVKVFEVEGR